MYFRLLPGLVLCSLGCVILVIVTACGARTGLLEPEEPVGELEQQSCTHPEVVKDCNDGWCRIPAGCFLMGSPADEPCREDPGYQGCGKETQHQVTLTHSFEIMDTEVTIQQFHEVTRVPADDSIPKAVPHPHPDHPNELDWHTAVVYCNLLSEQQGFPQCFDCEPDWWEWGHSYGLECSVKPDYADARIYDCPGYRLPTEAEWEYAYRAGTTSAYYNGQNDPAGCSECKGPEELAEEIAWYCLADSYQPYKVRQKKPNPWGLYDMAGNVYEWTLDGFNDDLGSQDVTDPVVSTGEDYHVIRGGSYYTEPKFLRASFRSKTAGTGGVGSRCVRSLFE